MLNHISVQSLVPANINFDSLQNRTFVGIDFGTSTSVVTIASYVDGEVKCETLWLKQKLEDGSWTSSDLLPTVIAWKNNNIYVGKGAAEMKFALVKGKNIWYSFKMELGEDLGVKYSDSELLNNPQMKIANPKDAARVFFWYINLLLTTYCRDHNLSTNIEYAVSIPASFEANQRKDLLDALEQNGIDVKKQSLIDEPNAAFLSFLLDTKEGGKQLLLDETFYPKVLVFDFGAGTCDISILQVGMNTKGVNSQNLSISKFTELGGDDIDRYIAYHYLLPRFLAYNDKKPEDFRGKEKEQIVFHLLGVAEKLKCMVSNEISLLMFGNPTVPEIKNSDTEAKITTDISLRTRLGILKQSDFFITYKEFTDTMQVFTGNFAKKIEGEKMYNTIHQPINDALRKANVTKDEVYYVLLIGGSSKNPFIKEALNNTFKESVLLIPSNLQTHVSKGAAIHSLLLNGMNKCFIRPITSEPIIAIIKNGEEKVIVPAGTTMPSDTFIVDDLVPSRDGQKIIEIPLCVGNKDKQLFNIEINAPYGDSFSITDPIKLVLEINADKMLLIQAECKGQKCKLDSQNPFANKELTTGERNILSIEKEINLYKIQHQTISKSLYQKLSNAYTKEDKYLDAAETQEEMNEVYPNSICLNNIALNFKNAGHTDRAIEYYKKALSERPNDPTITFNIGMAYKGIDNKLYEEYVKKAAENPDHSSSKVEMGHIEKRKHNNEEAKKYYKKAYELLYNKWKTRGLDSWDYGWFADVAGELDKYDIASQIREEERGLSTVTKNYEDENLTQTKINLLTD